MSENEDTTTTTTTVINRDAKYGKLFGKVDYDHEAAEQLAAALNEITELELRATQLKQIVAENDELHQFVWRTAGGIVMAVHDIEDSHLENIMLHLLRANRAIPRAIRGLAISRNLVIPNKVPIDWSEDVTTARQIRAQDRRDV